MKKQDNKVVAFNLGWIKIIGKEMHRTKKFVELTDVLEIKIDNLETLIHPIDYPLNAEVTSYMKVFDYKFEYGINTMITIKKPYEDMVDFIKNGIKKEVLSMVKNNLNIH